MRMTFLWGTFFILPVWFATFVIFRVGMATLAYGAVALLGIRVFTTLGWIAIPKTFLEFALWSVPGALAVIVTMVAIVLIIGSIYWIISKIGEAFTRSTTTESGDGEVSAVPVIGGFLKALHDKLCPIVTIGPLTQEPVIQ